MWLGVLVPPLLVAGGLAYLASVLWTTSAAPDPRSLALQLAGIGLVALVAGLAMARWIARGIRRGLARLDEALAVGHLAEPDPENPPPQWGEIGPITAGVRELLDRQRRLRRADTELNELNASIARAQQLAERWTRTERWTPLAPMPMAMGSLAHTLDRGFARLAELERQNLKAAERIHVDVVRVLDDARAAAELAERGYVDATALMTTVREIVRLASETRQAAQEPPEPPPAPAAPSPVEIPEAADWRAAAAEALEELIAVSRESVEHLGDGLLKVHEIGQQVQLLANRATLIALHAVAPPEADAARGESLPELKQLARDVRAATERVTEMTAEIDRDVRAAGDRMHGARERVLARLEAIPAPAPPMAPVVAPAKPAPAAPPIASLAQWVERLREMAQDANRKGERLSESQEGASGAAQRVARALDEEAQDLEGLVVRLAPTEIEAHPDIDLGIPAGEAPHRLSVIEPADAGEPSDEGREGGA